MTYLSINTGKMFPGFPYASVSKESACNAGDLSLIPGLGGYPGEGKGYPHQYSDLENYMDLYGVAESDTTERNFHIHTCIRKMVSYRSKWGG